MKLPSVTILLICAITTTTLFQLTQSGKSDHRYPSKYRNGPPMPPRPPNIPPYVKKWHMPMHGRFQHRRPFSSSSGSGGGAHSFPPGKFPVGLMNLGGGGTKHTVGGFIHPGISLQKQHQQQQQQLLQTQYLPLQHKGLPPLPPITKSQPSKYEIANLQQSKYEIANPQQSKYEIANPQQSKYEIANPQPSNYEIQRIPQQTDLWNNFKQLNQHIKTAYIEPSNDKGPFQSSPQINNLEYDYHIQTNSIPNNQQNHLIKQIDDNSGPIHTIPAPKLSLADKPKNMNIEELEYPKTHHKQMVKPSTGHKYTHVTIQKAHQYQVTEAAPLEKQLNNLQQVSQGGYFDFDANTKQADQQLQYQQLETLPQAQFLVQQPPDIGLRQHQQLPNQELLGLFSAVSQQPIVDVIALPLGHQMGTSYEAAAPLTNYPSVIGSTQVIQPDYVQFKTDVVGNMKPPEYHSFNYQESEYPQKRPQQELDIIYHHPQEQSAQESYQYGHQNQEVTMLENHHRNHQYHNQHSGGSKLQNNVPYNIDFVQQFFAQQENAPLESPTQEYSQSKEDAIVNAFYSTLPNKEAADALASLQEAGKLNTNSHVQQQRSASNGQTNAATNLKKAIPMTIYVPDDFDDPEDRKNISKKSITNNQQYFENVSHDEDNKDMFESMPENHEFGERIKTKQ